MTPPQLLIFSSGGVQEGSLSSPLQSKQQQQLKWKPSPALSFSSLARGLQLARPRVGGAAMGSVVEEEEPVPLAPLRLASFSKASFLSFPDIESACMEKGKVR